MEKQKQLAVRPTGLLFFLFTVSFSTLFVYCVVRTSGGRHPLHFAAVDFDFDTSTSVPVMSVELEFKPVREKTLSATTHSDDHLPAPSSGNGAVDGSGTMDCDIAKGKWVVDDTNPSYTRAACPFIDEGFDCEGNGRPDRNYTKWRWKPQDCELQRFSARKMLELIRGKRLVFVGDSLNRNQWESLLCLLMKGVSDPRKVYETHGRKITKERGSYCFIFEEYDCRVEFHVSHFLVHESKARVGKKRKQTLRIDAVDKGSSRRWRGADILVFNTAHWWNHQKTRAGVSYYQVGDRVIPQLDVMAAFRRAVSTWASWVDDNIDGNRTQIFFRSSAPSHFRGGGAWNTGGHCREARNPIIDDESSSDYPEKDLIVEEIIRKKMKTPVTVLNVTRLSEYRPDAHPSIYGGGRRRQPSEDCSHWCLPGVPDTWNQILFHYLLMQKNHKAVAD